MCDTLTTKIIGHFTNLNVIDLVSTGVNRTPVIDNYYSENSKSGGGGDLLDEVDNTTKQSNRVTISDSQQFDYTKEDARLKSFTNWPNKHINPDVLARAGFYSIQRGDAVRCAFCKVEAHRWMPHDDPMADHKQWMPRCPFLQQQNASGGTGTTESSAPHVGHDVCGTMEVFPNSLPEDATIQQLESLAVQRTQAYNANYKTEESRLYSYKKWPIALKQRPNAMARAGFYYLGSGDEVICYYCGGGLRNWKDTDEPWEQHARWFPKCTYLLMEKGREYVENVPRKLTAEGGGGQQPPLAATPTPTTNHHTKESGEDVATSDSSSSTTTTTTRNDNALLNVSDKGLCKICFKNDVRLVFRPCEHALTCVACGLAVDKCPVCRKPIERIDRMVLS